MNEPLWHRNDSTLPIEGRTIVAFCTMDTWRVGWVCRHPDSNLVALKCDHLYYYWPCVLFWAYTDELAQHVHNSLPKESL